MFFPTHTALWRVPWVDDVTKWPDLQFGDLYTYLGYDGRTTRVGTTALEQKHANAHTTHVRMHAFIIHPCTSTMPYGYGNTSSSAASENVFFVPNNPYH
jgi:hypothetical protein